MGSTNNWRTQLNMNDWMRDIEKRLMHEERRLQVAPAYDIVGPGISTYTQEVTDWNSDGPTVNGFFFSHGDKVVNSPDDSTHWMGIVQANAQGQGLQRVWQYVDDTMSIPSMEPNLFTRAFVTEEDGTRTYSDWLQGGGSGGGSSVIAGDGLTKTGDTIDVGGGNGLNVNSDSIEVDFGGSGSSVAVAHADHSHGGTGSATAAHVHAYRGSGSHTVASSTWEVLAFNAIKSQSGTAITVALNSSTPPGAVFTIHEDGTYDCSSSVLYPSDGGGRRAASIYVNGMAASDSAAQSEFAPTAGGSTSAITSTTLRLAAGDTVMFATYQNSGAGLALTVRSQGDLYWGRITKVDAAPGPVGPVGPQGPAGATTNWKQSVRVAASDPFFNINSPGASIDGVASMAAGDRVLVTSLLSGANNGIYVWNGAAVPMTRAADADEWTEFIGAMVVAEQGVTYSDTIWQCLADRGGTLGTTTQGWRRLRGLIRVDDEGLGAQAETAIINFKGAGVTATSGAGANTVDVTIPGGGSPTGTAGGDLTGTYPNPQIAAGVITDADVAAANKDGTDSTPSMRTLGTGAQQAAAGNHAHAPHGIAVQDQNTPEGTGVTTLDFQGAGVSVAVAGTEAVVTIPGGGGGGTSVPTGCMMMWPTATPPSGWLLCDGLTDITGTPLATVLGSNVTPDLRGKFPLGAGVTAGSGTNRALGATGGFDEHTLTLPQTPSHSHAHTHSITHGHNAVRNVADGTSSITYRAGFNDGNNVSGANVIVDHTGNSGAASAHAQGGGTAHPTLNPFLAVNFIIKT